MAFVSLVDNPGLLDALPRDQARRLGAQAEAYAGTLLRDGVSSASSVPAGAVIRVVRQFCARDELRGDGVDDMVASALDRSANGLGGLIRTLEGEGFLLGESTAALAVAAVLMLGSEGLQRIGQENGDVLMSAASRQAARHLRSDVRRPAPSGEGVDGAARVLQIVEAACRNWGTLPLAPGWSDEGRQCAGHLVELWRDAATCAAHAQGPARMWEDARDGHAFGAVWVWPPILPALVRTEAEQLARDARSAAGFVVRRPSIDSGSRAAVEAARAVIVSCGGWTERQAGAAQTSSVQVRPTGVPARAFLV
jgi:hypothetical protein